VTVLQVPKQLDLKDRTGFLQELENSICNGRPYLVLDCSGVCQVDKTTAELLLFCLEQAMKRNGDVKLAGIRLPGYSGLGFVGAGRLFEVFEQVEDAVKSFHQPTFETAESAA
jgi:anti-sigma B factor antagonist